MSSSSESSNGFRNEVSEVKCWCGMEMKLFTSKTQDNPGRPFFRCVKRLGDSKSVKGNSHDFKWVEDVLLDEMVKGKSEMEEMKKAFEDLSEVVLASNRKIRKNELIGKFGACVILMVIVYLVVFAFEH